jgi:superfamily II DNA or RNA helicase
LAGHLGQYLKCGFLNPVVYPEAKPLPWAKKPPALRPYQEEAKAAMLEGKHCAVSMGTGLGKTLCALYICRDLGLQATVMVPSLSIADQMLADFTKYLGSKYVGQYGGGKKKIGKLITIAVAASLARIEPGSPAAEHFAATQVFVADESHLTPAETLKAVCTGLLVSAPYRFFFSGTQMRGDGADLLLQGIIGPIVYNMTVKQGVDTGFLARPVFKMFKVRSEDTYSGDPNVMTRRHLYYNPKVNALAADIANKAVSLLGHKVLILVDEFEQFASLLPYFRHVAKFAHGGIGKGNKDKLPVEFHDSDPTSLVAEFNAGNIPILVGTSCIATGTDVKAVQTMIYLRGGKSEVEVKQSVGRTTRLMPEIRKTYCNVVDFKVYVDSEPSSILEKHADQRAALFDDIYGPIETIEAR